MLLRIYGQIVYENPETVVSDSVIYGLLAEKQIGPKLHGVFTGGRVEEYVKSHTLFAKDLHRPCIFLGSAKIMADFHKLTMPLIKEPHWLFETIQRYLDDGLNNVSRATYSPEDKAKLQKLLSYGSFPAEFECLKRILAQVASPVVFCHNDLQEGNILYKESSDVPRGWELVPIDFEYASYNWRGYDIANFFCEWVYEYHIDKPPYYTAIIEDYPTREQQRAFCEAYLKNYKGDSLDAGDTENEKNFNNEVDHLMLEADAYRLASHFFWGLWSVVQSYISQIKFGYLDYGLTRMDHYFKHKKELLEQNEFLQHIQ